MKRVKSNCAPPQVIFESLHQLSTIPEWLDLWTRSACRVGAMRSLALAKAYNPRLNPAPFVKGFPQYNADGTKFGGKDFKEISAQTRPIACKIAEGLNLSVFQDAVDENNTPIPTPEPEHTDLLAKLRDSIAKKKKTTTPSTSTPAVPAPSRAPTTPNMEKPADVAEDTAKDQDTAQAKSQAKAPEDNPASVEAEAAKGTSTDNPAM